MRVEHGNYCALSWKLHVVLLMLAKATMNLAKPWRISPEELRQTEARSTTIQVLIFEFTKTLTCENVRH